MDLSNTSLRYLIKALIVIGALYVYQSGINIWNKSSGIEIVVTEDELKNIVTLLEEKYNIDIDYSGDEKSFPELFRLAPASAYAKPLTKSVEHRQNVFRVVAIISSEIKKYPEKLLSLELDTIYLFTKMGIYNVPYGGTSIDKSIYLAIGDNISERNKLYIKGLFHHELSSVFLRRFKFPADKWVKCNPKGFTYKNIKEEILIMVKENGNLDGSSVLYKQGFLDEYGTATMEEDFNLYAAQAFSNPERLKKLSDQYPAIRNKVEILKKYYLGISADFSNVFSKI